MVSTASIVAIAGASIAAPLAMPADGARDAAAGRACCTVSLRTVSVVRMASAAAASPGGVGGQLGAELRDTRLDRVHRHGDADQAGLAHEDVGGRATDRLRGELAHAERVGTTLLPRRRVGVARSSG